MLRALLKALLKLFLRVRLSGDTGRLGRGPALVVANHDSLLDALLVAVFLPGRPLIMLPHAVAASWPGRMARRVADCMEFGDAAAQAVRHLLQELRAGRTVVVFPQERVSANGSPMKVYDAAAVLAAHADTDLLPLRIEGSLYTRWAGTGLRWPHRWFGRVTLVLQPALRFPARKAGKRRQMADDLLRIMQQSMAMAALPRTLFGALLDAVALFGRRTRIIEDVRDQLRTYGDLLKGSLALGRLIERITLPGEHVGILMPNLGVTVCLIFGLTSRGRVAAMLNYSGGVEALRGACEVASLRTIITSRSFVDTLKLEPILAGIADRRIVYLEDLRASLTVLDKLWLIGALLRPHAAVPPQDPAATAVILFTSGSEARPKGVALSHRGMLSGMAQLRAVIDFGPEDKFLNALPMFHIFGLVSCTLMPLLTGTRLCLYVNPLHYRQIPELAYTRDCTYIFGTSTFLGNYARQAHPYDFNRARFVIAGGEKLHPEVAQLWFSKFGVRVYEGYGATECGPAMALNTPLEYRAGTVGRLLPCIESRIVPVPGIEHGGVLHVRGPNQMQGYYFHDRPGLLQPPRSEVGDGWYNTGDVVLLDEDGFLTIQGRVKRFAKIAGEMVSLERVEYIACQASPEYKHAALVEMTHSGESTVLMTTDPALDRAMLLLTAKSLKAHELAVARRVVKVDALPLLGSGKVDYVTLKQMVVL